MTTVCQTVVPSSSFRTMGASVGGQSKDENSAGMAIWAPTFWDCVKARPEPAWKLRSEIQIILYRRAGTGLAAKGAGVQHDDQQPFGCGMDRRGQPSGPCTDNGDILDLVRGSVRSEPGHHRPFRSGWPGAGSGRAGSPRPTRPQKQSIPKGALAAPAPQGRVWWPVHQSGRSRRNRRAA